MKIRLAHKGDLKAIVAIYNEAILETTATFDTETKTVESQREWFNEQQGKYPIFVCEVDGEIAGWASLSAWSDRCAYSDTAENSVSRISDGNEASIKLHKQFGFKEIGVMKEVGKKFGRLIDVNLMQLMVSKTKEYL